MIKLPVTAALVLLGAFAVPGDPDVSTAQTGAQAASPAPLEADLPAPAVLPAPPAPGKLDLSLVTVFEITGSAKEYHFESKTVMKSKTFKTNVKAAAASACVVSGCFGLSPSDPGGKAYIFFDSDQSTMMLATNTAGTGAVTLTGHAGADGFFVMSGVHAGSDTAITMTGKVKYAKGTFTPTKIDGKFTTVSRGNAHSSEGKIKTVGSAIIF